VVPHRCNMTPGLLSHGTPTSRLALAQQEHLQLSARSCFAMAVKQEVHQERGVKAHLSRRALVPLV